MLHQKGEERRRFFFTSGMAEQYLKLSDERKLRLMRAFIAWAFDDTDTDFSDDEVLDVAWPPLRQALEVSVEQGMKNRVAGVRSGEARRKKSAKKFSTNTVPNAVRNTLPNEKRREDMSREETNVFSSSAAAASGGAAADFESGTPQGEQGSAWWEETDEDRRRRGVTLEEVVS